MSNNSNIPKKPNYPNSWLEILNPSCTDDEFDTQAATEYLRGHRKELLCKTTMARFWKKVAKAYKKEPEATSLKAKNLAKRVILVSNQLDLAPAETLAVMMLAASVLLSCKKLDPAQKNDLLLSPVAGSSVLSRCCDLLTYPMIQAKYLQSFFPTLTQEALKPEFLGRAEAQDMPVDSSFYRNDTPTPLEVLCNLPSSQDEHGGLKLSLLNQLITTEVVVRNMPEHPQSLENLTVWAAQRQQWNTVKFILENEPLLLDTPLSGQNQEATLRLHLLQFSKTRDLLHSSGRLLPRPESWSNEVNTRAGFKVYQSYLNKCWLAASPGGEAEIKLISNLILQTQVSEPAQQALLSHDAYERAITELPPCSSIVDSKRVSFRDWLSNHPSFSFETFKDLVSTQPYQLRSVFVIPYLEEVLMPMVSASAKAILTQQAEGFHLNGGPLMTPLLLDLYHLQEALSDAPVVFGELEFQLENVITSASILLNKIESKKFTYYQNKHFQAPNQPEEFSAKPSKPAQYNTADQSTVCQWELEAFLLGLPVPGANIYKCGTDVGADLGETTPYIRLDSIGNGEHSHPINFGKKGYSYNYETKMQEQIGAGATANVLRYFQLQALRDLFKNSAPLRLLDNSGCTSIDLEELPTLEDLLQLASTINPENIPMAVPDKSQW